jgi:hypothetical protein
MRWKSRWIDLSEPRVCARAESADCRRASRRCFAFGRSLTVALLLPALSGCQHYYGDPFRDPYAGVPEVSTASSQRLAELEAAPQHRERDHESMQTQTASGTVVHGPLYFEDDILLTASRDGQFRWTWEDYVGIFYGDGRFLLNGMALPVSMGVYPPWTPAYSTGEDLSHPGLP